MTEQEAPEGKPKSWLDKLGLKAWLGLILSIEFALAVILSVVVVSIPICVWVTMSVYVTRVTRHEPTPGEPVRLRAEALTGARRLRAAAMLVSIVALLLAIIGDRAFAGCVLALTLGVGLLAAPWRAVFRKIDGAGVLRVAHPDSHVRSVVAFLRLDGVTLRADGSANLPTMYLGHVVALVFALLSQVAGPAVAQNLVMDLVPETKSIFQAIRQVPKPTPPPTMVPSVGPPPSFSGGSPSSAPTELTVSPCPPEDQVLATMSIGVPPKIGRALFGAWRPFGGAVIGCPDAPPHKVGSLWVQSLENGEDTPSDLVYGDGHAAAVLSDLYNITLDQLPDVSWVDARVRWGLGTMQLLHMRDGGCQLAQRYEQPDTRLLTPAPVTAAVIALGHKFGAVPWVRSRELVTGGYAFEVHFIAPGDTASKFRDLQTITFRYTNGRVVRTDTDALVATIRTRCPSVATNLSTTAAQVERTVQAGHG